MQSTAYGRIGLGAVVLVESWVVGFGHAAPAVTQFLYPERPNPESYRVTTLLGTEPTTPQGLGSVGAQHKRRRRER